MTVMTEPNGGRLVISVLAERGVERIFSVSGGPLNPIYAATIDSPVQLVHTRHEAGAGFMADATARLTGVPGVCAVTLGPGVTNTASAVLTAYLAGVPMLVLAGQAPVNSFDRGAIMSFDPLPLMSSITKWSARVLSADRIPEYLDMAWRHMLSGRPGPVFLELPVDVLGAACSTQALGRRPGSHPRGPSLSTESSSELRNALADAARPILVVGDDVHWSKAGPLVHQVVDRLQIPFVVMRLARGAVDERHQLFAGVGYLAANATLRRALEEADVVFLLGHEFEGDLSFGDSIRSSTRVLQSHPDAARLGRNLGADLAVCATSDDVLRTLLEAGASGRRDVEWVEGVAKQWRQERSEHSIAAKSYEWPLHPVRVVELVTEAVPEDTIFVTSHGNIDFWADAHLQMCGRSHYLRAGQSGALGAEVPYGVAAGLACRPSAVVVFVGDGGFGFHGLELETAARYDVPVIVVVADDNSWAAIALPLRRVHGIEVEMGLPRRDWSQLAEAIGCHGEAPTDAEEIGNAIRRSLDSGKPSIVHVPIASVESPYMRFISGD